MLCGYSMELSGARESLIPAPLDTGRGPPPLLTMTFPHVMMHSKLMLSTRIHGHSVTQQHQQHNYHKFQKHHQVGRDNIENLFAQHKISASTYTINSVQLR